MRSRSVVRRVRDGQWYNALKLVRRKVEGRVWDNASFNSLVGMWNDVKCPVDEKVRNEISKEG